MTVFIGIRGLEFRSGVTRSPGLVFIQKAPCLALEDKVGLTVRRSAASWPMEDDYSGLLAWRKGKMNTSNKGLACLNFSFPPGKQGKVVPLLWPSSCRAPHCQTHTMVFGTAVFGVVFIQKLGQIALEIIEQQLVQRSVKKICLNACRSSQLGTNDYRIY